MSTFGKIKDKILDKAAEAILNKDKKEIQKLVEIIKSKDFKELYLLYEDVEIKYIKDKDIAKFYVEELSKSLNGRYSSIRPICKKIDKSIVVTESKQNPIYDMLDTLLEEDNLLNIETKIRAKSDLLNHLTTEKKSEEPLNTPIVENENLLHAVLANNFNLVYSNTLSEEDKKEFKNIITLTEEELKTKTIQLKESVLSQINQILSESKDNDLVNKLNKVKEEIQKTEITKYGYYKLKELKNGLN